LKLSYLIKEIVPAWNRMLATDSESSCDPEISSIHSNSGTVRPGGLFIAVKGFNVDGHDYIDDAFKRGALAVISERRVQGNPMVIQVKNTRKAMGYIAARFFQYPSEKICLTGITGTNGKTTTAWILESILKVAGIYTGVIGTVNWRYGGNVHDTPVTTPESIDLQEMMFKMHMAGVTHVIMEVSSHGIDLNRIGNCSFDIGVFTNLTQDHLDYHKTMAKYFSCKKRFFTKILKKGPKALKASAVINLDHEKGRKLAEAVKLNTITISTKADEGINASITSHGINEDIIGMSGEIKIAGKSFPFKSGLTGHFNLENILCAAGAAHGLGISSEIIIKGIEECREVPGRLERIGRSSKRFIFVDYSHTPDALKSILKTLKKRAPARLICAFGCGGDRDRQKRPVMGSIAAKYSDFAIVTSDNPRSEEPMAIIKDILKGMNNSDITEYTAEDLKSGFKDKGYFIEPDRKKALEIALMISKPNDIVVAAGKGHETYQVLKNGTIDFDDRKVLRDVLVDYGFQGGNSEKI